MFQMEGAQVEVVTNARELSNNPNLLKMEITAALIDVHFGDVNGLRLIGPLSQSWPGVTLVMMTANHTNDYAVLAEARELGAHLVLPKPFDQRHVREIMSDFEAIHRTGKRRKHIVVIDESRTTLRIASDLLKTYGYRVSTFQDALEAIQKLSFDHVDLVLTDTNMAAMSGKEVISLVRDVWKEVGIVTMSTIIPIDKKAGPGDAFVPKPFGPDELISAIRTVSKMDFMQLEC